MTALALATIAYNKPRLIGEQIRLLAKYLDEDYALTVVDNSTDVGAAGQIEVICAATGTAYVRSEHGEHVPALQMAWDDVLWPSGAPVLGMLDHDVFPTEKCTLLDRIADAGFLGVGQFHAPTNRLYVWPGYAFFERQWIGERKVDWGGIRAENKADDGDTGSMLWTLFADEDWDRIYRGRHGYEAIRQPDTRGLQSWGYERLNDSWVHFTNGSGWMRVKDFEERERLLHELLESL